MNTRDQSGGVNIIGSRVSISGDIVGRDKYAGTESPIVKQFARIKREIDQRAADPNIDKSELRGLVENIEGEVKKGQAGNPKKVERWLRFLADVADDIFQVTVATLSNPIAGVTKAIQLVAQRAAKSATE